MRSSNREARKFNVLFRSLDRFWISLGCSYEHKTVMKAASCIPCAGGYVVGVEDGAMRSLTAEEESEFQCAVPGHSTDNPAVETTPATPAEAGVGDRGYAVMIRIRVGDCWTWSVLPLPHTSHNASMLSRSARRGPHRIRLLHHAPPKGRPCI